jgi:predicted nucleic acid-binding protein
MEFWWENQRQKEYVIDLVVDGRIILSEILKNRLGVKDWIYLA